MDNFLKSYFVSDTITKYENNLIKNVSQTIFGLRFSEYAFLLEKNSIIVVNNVDEAVKLQNQLDSIHVKSFLIKSTNLSPLYSEINRNEQEIDLLKGVNLLIAKKIDVLIVLPEVLIQKFPTMENYLKNSIKLEMGKSLDIQKLVSALIKNGFNQ